MTKKQLSKLSKQLPASKAAPRRDPWALALEALHIFWQPSREGAQQVRSDVELFEASLLAKSVIESCALLASDACTGEERRETLRRVNAVRRAFSPLLDARTEKQGRLKLMKEGINRIESFLARSNWPAACPTRDELRMLTFVFNNEFEGAIPKDEMPPDDIVEAAISVLVQRYKGVRRWPKLHLLAKALGCGTATDRSFQQNYHHVEV